MSPRLRLITCVALLCTIPAVNAAQSGSPEVAVTDIYNYHPVDADLATAGQVSDEQVPALTAAGFEMVVNLAVADEARNAREGFLVAREGIAYTQIPVSWDAPTLDDLALFFAVMDAREERRTLVHCFANFRASAFTYLYRTLRLGVPEAEARKDLDAIWTEEAWEEYPQWRAFIADARTRFST